MVTSQIQLVDRFIQLINIGKIDATTQLLDEQLIYRTFSLSQGEYIEISGRSNVLSLLKENMDQAEIEIRPRKIFGDRTNICLIGEYGGSQFVVPTMGTFDYPFTLEVVVTFEINANKITHIKLYSNTFQVLRMIGKTTFERNINDYKRYLHVLHDMGLLSEI